MAYAKQTWKDGAEGETPISAERLNHMETGIADGQNATVNWGNLSGKPETFAPTIGTTATTAMAGNKSIPSIPAVMSAEEASNGIATTQRTITAKVLADLVDERIAAALPAGG